MDQASITLNGRIYRLNCGAGEEDRLRLLSDIVAAKLENIVAEFGQVGDDRLLLMSALLIADDMLEAKNRLTALEASLATTRKG